MSRGLSQYLCSATAVTQKFLLHDVHGHVLTFATKLGKVGFLGDVEFKFIREKLC